MVQWIVKAFLALVVVFFVLMHPDRVIDFIELFINGAAKAADSLAQIKPNTK